MSPIVFIFSIPYFILKSSKFENISFKTDTNSVGFRFFVCGVNSTISANKIDTSLCLSAITDSPDFNRFAIFFGRIFNKRLSDFSFSLLISLNNSFSLSLRCFFSMHADILASKIVLSNGAQKDKVDLSGKTALEYAKKNNHKKIVELLK